MSIGTYGTFKLKNAIKDIARTKGADHAKTNFVTAGIDTEASFSQLFQIATQKPAVKDFIQTYSEVIEQLPLCLNQPKNSSIHAAGVVIVPREFGTISEQLPVKRSEENLVSEWEGNYIDQAGYLKCDILGIKQLDKFAAINKLIKETEQKNIRFKDIDLNNPKVLELFKLGYNEDVFQFGALGLKAYCKELGPDNIEDLIATVALYRPGPIESGAHKRYAQIKNGYKIPEYEEGTKHITQVTYGEIIYQEQIMQVFRDVGGFTLVEADELRKVIAKTGMEISKKKEILGKFIDRFVEGGVGKGLSKEGCERLWDKIEKFATYSFNRSHAACYAITGYYSQWFKVNYPLQFWTVSLQYSNDDEIVNRISEIQKTSNIQISPVDINESHLTFKLNLEQRKIYWALPSVKWVGDKVVESILEERNKNGKFFSLEEFCDRMKGYSGVNKRAIAHLIISGAFDQVSNLKSIKNRFDLLEIFTNFTASELKDEYKLMQSWREHQWVLKQKELTGFGFVDFKRALNTTSIVGKIKYYKENSEILLDDVETVNTTQVLVCGILNNLIERNSKKGKFAQLEILDNSDKIFVTCWNETYEELKEELKQSEGKIVAVSGKLCWDSYKNSNTVHTTNDSKIVII